MPHAISAKAGLDALLKPENSVLILIDHQPFQFANLHSHEPTVVVNNIIGLAKTAKISSPSCSSSAPGPPRRERRPAQCRAGRPLTFAFKGTRP